MDEHKGVMYDGDQIAVILVNQLSSILSQCQAIGEDSCTKALYKGPNILLLCKTSGKAIREKDTSLLTSFELPDL